MKIGIIGSGNVGTSLGSKWAKAGHEIMYGSRNPQKAQKKVSALGGKVKAGSVQEAAEFGEVVVLAVPWNAVEETLQKAGSLKGKVLVDCTNPMGSGKRGLALSCETSAGEQIAQMASDAKVVKAFNCTGSGNMQDPEYGGTPADVFICGDDSSAKQKVTKLAKDIGFDPVDAGPISNAYMLENLAMLWMTLAYQKGLGPNIAFKLLKR